MITEEPVPWVRLTTWLATGSGVDCPSLIVTVIVEEAVPFAVTLGWATTSWAPLAGLLARGDLALVAMARGALADDLQVARRIRRAHRPAVHGRGRERRLIADGGDVLGQHPTDGGGERHAFGGPDDDFGQHAGTGVVHREELHHLTPLIPAKTGTQSLHQPLDSRFRGNERNDFVFSLGCEGLSPAAK